MSYEPHFAVGEKYSDLTFEKIKSRNHNDVVWVCRCSCGKMVSYSEKQIFRGGAYDCGNCSPADFSNLNAGRNYKQKQKPLQCNTCKFEPGYDDIRKGVLCKLNSRPDDDERGNCKGHITSGDQKSFYPVTTYSTTSTGKLPAHR